MELWMDLNELRELRITEGRLDVPQDLPDSFYDTVTADMAALRNRIDSREDTADLEQQLEAYESELSMFYQYRVRKITECARRDALHAPTEPTNLTEFELMLFGELKAAMQMSHKLMFDDLLPVYWSD